MARYQYAPRGSLRAWLAGIVAEDAQENGGYGLLELRDCPECGGAGYVPATAAEMISGNHSAGYAICDQCNGSGGVPIDGVAA